MLPSLTDFRWHWNVNIKYESIHSPQMRENIVYTEIIMGEWKEIGEENQGIGKVPNPKKCVIAWDHYSWNYI